MSQKEKKTRVAGNEKSHTISWDEVQPKGEDTALGGSRSNKGGPYRHCTIPWPTIKLAGRLTTWFGI